MAWLDSEDISYLAWAWNADFACSSGPGLITDYTGTPTAYGAGLQGRLASPARRLRPASAAEAGLAPRRRHWRGARRAPGRRCCPPGRAFLIPKEHEQ